MSRNRIIAASALLFALIAIPVVLFIVSRSSPNVVEVDGQKITKSELEKVASEQYTKDSLDNEVLTNTTDTVVERRILDKLSASNSISASDQEISQQLEAGASSPEVAKYEVLKGKVTNSLVKNWELHSIRFWIPADRPSQVGGQTVYKAPDDLTPQEASLRLRQVEDTPKFLAEAETMLKTDTPLNVAQTLSRKYTSLSTIIAVNNNFITDYVANSPFASDYTNPEIVTENELHEDLYANTIRSMTSPGEIKKVQSEHNGGGAVFKLEKANLSAPYSTYEELLREESKKLSN